MSFLLSIFLPKNTGTDPSSSPSNNNPAQTNEEQKTNKIAQETIPFQQFKPQPLNYEVFDKVRYLSNEELDQHICSLVAARQFRKKWNHCDTRHMLSYPWYDKTSEYFKENLPEMVLELKTCIAKEQWSDFDLYIQINKQSLNDSEFTKLLEAIKKYLLDATIRYCDSNSYNPHAFRVIQEAIKHSPILIYVVEELLKYCRDDFSQFNRGIRDLLCQDSSEININMIAARSKVIGHFLRNDSKYILEFLSCPTFFLSHDSNAVEYPGYKEDRNLFIDFFKKTPDAFHIILNFIPKGYCIPSDGLEIFQDMARDPEKKKHLQIYLQKCLDSPVKEKLLNIIREA